MASITYATKHGGAAGHADGDPPEPGELALKLKWVRGIESKLDDLVIRGESFTTHFGDDALLTGTLVRKIVGASELKITVSDPYRRLLNKPIVAEKHELELDGLHWILAKVSGPGIGQPMTLTYEPRVVKELKELVGPVRGRREQMTRAEFAKKLTELLAPRRRPRFISPLLHVKEPIKSDKEAKKANAEAPGSRGRGLKGAKGLQYAGSNATPAMIEVGEISLRTAESNAASTLVMEALMVALMDESGLGSLTEGKNVLEGEGAAGAEIAGTAKEVSNFLRGEGGYGEGAIQVAQRNPSYSPAEIATTVQRNLAFLQGGLSAGAEPYERFSSEASEWVEAWGGGSTVTNETLTKKYEFTVGKKENLWKAMVRLAGEVNWRCFESAGWIYFIDEIELLKQATLMQIRPTTPALENFSYDHDEGKDEDEVTLTARARAWEAPPGTAVEVSGWGPVDGTYLVSQIEGPVARQNAEVKITLKRPHKPLKEPAAERETRELGGATGNNGNSPKSAPNAPAAVDAMLAAMEEIEGEIYSWAGGHNPQFAPGGEEENGGPGYDCSGALSYVLHKAGLIEAPQTSGEMATEFEPGKGEWFVIYANSVHVWCEIRTKDGWLEWEEGGTKGPAGFLPSGTQSPSGYSARHPKGL